MDTTPPTITAVRTRHGKASRVTVRIVDIPGISAIVHELGGKRAERAAAAIVYAHPNHSTPDPRVYGLRSDLAAAETEARRLVTATQMRHGGGIIPLVPATWAVAVPVVDA